MNRYSISELSERPTLLSNRSEMPFQITKNNRVVGEVVPPGTDWPQCEHCNEVTPNVMQFKDKKRNSWRKLVLCNKCKADLL